MHSNAKPCWINLLSGGIANKLWPILDGAPGCKKSRVDITSDRTRTE